MRRIGIAAALWTAAAVGAPPDAAPAVDLPGLITAAGLQGQADAAGIFTIGLAEGAWKYHCQVALSPNRRFVWISFPLQRMPKDRAGDARPFTRLLAENFRVAPAAFAYNEQSDMMVLQRAVESRGVTGAILRLALDETATSFRETAKLWDASQWPPVGTAPAGTPPARPPEAVGSTLTEAEAADLLQRHNKARREVNVGDLRWSPELARFAQEWADEIARTGQVAHRPREGRWIQKYGENIAIGYGPNYGLTSGVDGWYGEKAAYVVGTPIPAGAGDPRTGHYTQMVWSKTTEMGAAKAIIQTGERKGWLVVVCNYNPSGNYIGQKPF